MTVNEFAKKCELQVLCLPDGEREITGGYVGDLLSWVMGRANSGDAWITIMSNPNIVAVASLSDVACIVLAEGVTAEKEVLDSATMRGINILSSTADAFSLSALLAKEIL